ncbi:hypothetical protein [Arthrobacter sp. JCM 19049]|uniref:hypothetical protein n=1 Tax=Arthrobacter sp. JCM 19049 TaxID=1460643 RepID=UPI0024367DAB|nr:hypothetical protein [Arthrobacter sp. JCM 19049]
MISAHQANRLVGNLPGAPVIETLAGSLRCGPLATRCWRSAGPRCGSRSTAKRGSHQHAHRSDERAVHPQGQGNLELFRGHGRASQLPGGPWRL